MDVTININLVIIGMKTIFIRDKTNILSSEPAPAADFAQSSLERETEIQDTGDKEIGVWRAGGRCCSVLQWASRLSAELCTPDNVGRVAAPPRSITDQQPVTETHSWHGPSCPPRLNTCPLGTCKWGFTLPRVLGLFNNNFLCNFTQEFTLHTITLPSPAYPDYKYATLSYENKLKSNQKK